MVYMGGKAKNNSSRANQTSHYAVMGGIAPQRGVRRFMLRRARNRQTIPALPKPGLQYMRDHDILSRNPVGSGGIGRIKNIVDLSVGVAGHGGDFGASGGVGPEDRGNLKRTCAQDSGGLNIVYSACGWYGYGGATSADSSGSSEFACCITDGEATGTVAIGNWPAAGNVDGIKGQYNEIADGKANCCQPAPCGRAWSQIPTGQQKPSPPNSRYGPSGEPVGQFTCNLLANVPMVSEEGGWVPLGVPADKSESKVWSRGWSETGSGVLDWLRQQIEERGGGVTDEDIDALNTALNLGWDGTDFASLGTSGFQKGENTKLELEGMATSKYYTTEKHLSLYDFCACAPSSSPTDLTDGTPSQQQALANLPPSGQKCDNLVGDITPPLDSDLGQKFNIALRK